MIRFKYFIILTTTLLLSCSDSTELKDGRTLKVKRNADNIITDSLTFNKGRELDGLIKSTDEEGFVLYIDYNNGVKDGIYKDFYENSKLHIKGHFKNGKKWREWVEYREDGVISRYEAYTPEEDLVYLRIYDKKGSLVTVKGEAFMFYTNNPEDSVIYVNDTLFANIFIAYPPNCILKARTLLYNPNDSIVSVAEYNFNKAFIGIKEYFKTEGMYKFKTYWIMKDTIENKVEKGVNITEYKVVAK